MQTSVEDGGEACLEDGVMTVVAVHPEFARMELVTVRNRLDRRVSGFRLAGHVTDKPNAAPQRANTVRTAAPILTNLSVDFGKMRAMPVRYFRATLLILHHLSILRHCVTVGGPGQHTAGPVATAIFFFLPYIEVFCKRSKDSC